MYIAVAVIIVLLLSGLRVAQEYQRGVVFRLGRFTGVRGPGLFWIIPLGIERWVNIFPPCPPGSRESERSVSFHEWWILPHRSHLHTKDDWIFGCGVGVRGATLGCVSRARYD